MSTFPEGSAREIGTVIDGKYEVLGVLGRGGMAVVYEARDLMLRRRVAIKMSLAGHCHSLAREAQALAAIRHPGFATMYHLGTDDSCEYLAMERIFGETLAARIEDFARKKTFMPLGDVLDILIGVTDALSAAHGAGVAQRDLKPSNVILAGERIVIVDFGLFIPEVLVSPENDICGTPDYLAPEVLTRSVEPGSGPLIDLYSLGVLAYELLTNQTPFAAEEIGRIIARHLTADIPDVSRLRAMPIELSALVHDLMSKDPSDRPPSAEAVLWQLKYIRDRGDRLRQTMTVVAIDDDAALGRALQRNLTSTFPGLEVRATTNHRAAFDRPTPDVVLVDLHMPEANGLEVCMELMSIPESRRPVVVAMSANAADADIDVLHSIGVRHFMAKDESFVSSMSALISRVRHGESYGPRSSH